MRRQLRYIQFFRVHLDDVPDDLVGYPVTPNGSRTADAPKQLSFRNSRCSKPVVQQLLYPVRYRDCPDVAAFSDKIDDRATVLTTLKMVEANHCGVEGDRQSVNAYAS